MSRALGLRPWWRECCIAYLRWALREIHPLHPDVPGIVIAVRHLEAERTAR